MPVGLLPIIYLAFISLGLPDAALGSAWPLMAPALGAGISWVGAVTMIISAGTIVSSLMSVRVVERFGTGRVTAVSVLLTAAGLAGFALSGEFWQLCLWAVPYGLGAGAVDAALNAYVAVHYESQHMSWLHCMWGVGASAGPLIMAQCLGVGTWSLGFLVLGGIQVAIVAVLTLSLPLWKEKKLPHSAAGQGAEESGDDRVQPARFSRMELLRRDGVPAVLLCFFCYCALESTCGNWAATYCTLGRGISAEVAASWASYFYIGITVGRALSGFISLKVRDHNMIRLGQALVAAGIACIVLPLDESVLLVGLVLVGAWLRAHLPIDHPCHPGALRRRRGSCAHGHADGVRLCGEPCDVAAFRRARADGEHRAVSVLSCCAAHRDGCGGREAQRHHAPPHVKLPQGF